MEVRPVFKGKLVPRKMKGLFLRAYNAWVCQRNRCNNPKSNDYKTYGARGVRVRYTSREFVQWYVDNHPKNAVEKYVVGRIDHSKDYCFGNIEFQTASENSKEVALRSHPTMVLSIEKVFEIRRRLSVRQRGDITRIAKEFGVHQSTVSRIIRKEKWGGVLL